MCYYAKATKQQRERRRPSTYVHIRSNHNQPTMVDATLEGFRDIGFEQPRRTLQLRLLYRLAVVTLLVVAVVPSTHGRCAAVGRGCSCYIVDGHDYLHCKEFGNISQVPPFRRSNTIYYKIWLSSGTISTVQAGAFRNVKVKNIKLTDIGVTSVKPGAFSGLEDILERIEIDGNRLEAIEDDVLTGFNKLIKLDMSRNRLKTLNKFGNLTRLKELYLYNNQLETIPHDAFDGLNQLRVLYMYRNRLEILEPGLFSQLTELVALNLSFNHIY